MSAVTYVRNPTTKAFLAKIFPDPAYDWETTRPMFDAFVLWAHMRNPSAPLIKLLEDKGTGELFRQFLREAAKQDKAEAQGREFMQQLAGPLGRDN